MQLFAKNDNMSFLTYQRHTGLTWAFDVLTVLSIFLETYIAIR